MARVYQTCEVEDILGVGEHVLRYWERAIPILSPKRTLSGRRMWTDSDISLLLRIKHLVRDKGMDLDIVMEQLLKERSGKTASDSAIISELKADLVKTYFETKELLNKIENSKKDN